jgi:hypothetical protein
MRLNESGGLSSLFENGHFDVCFRRVSEQVLQNECPHLSITDSKRIPSHNGQEYGSANG